MKYCVLTFGCRANQADSFDVERDLRAQGGEPSSAESADVVVVNTCTVTAAADQAARNAIRRIARLNPVARIVATGCYATRHPEEVQHLPGVLTLVPNSGKARLVHALEPGGDSWLRHSGSGEGRKPRAESQAPPPFRPGARGRTAYPIKVQSGCDERCAYCVVPHTRGAGCSRPPEAVRDEVALAASAGYREVWISGVHLGSYGRDLRPATSLVELLRVIEGAASGSGLSFRLCSLEPMDCGEELIRFLAGSSRFMPHLHLPLQHASDRILRAMRRPYTRSSFDAVVGAIRRELPDAAIGTDLIAGLPGETERDFAEQLDYLRASSLTHVHVFPYSARPGTEASRMPGKVPGAEIRRRAAELREIAAELNSRFVRRQLGRDRDALTLGDGTIALTDNYLKVQIAHGRQRNERIRVRVVSAQPLRGEVV